MTCKFKINSYQDRMNLVGILASAGYKVTIETHIKKDSIISEKEYFVAVEYKENNTDIIENKLQLLLNGLKIHPDGWIDINKEAPPENVLVFLKCKYIDEYITIGNIINGQRGTALVSSDIFNRSAILAWKPLN